MVIDDIRDLLAAPDPGDAALFLERLDAALTAGYAHALELEAERFRIERRIGEVLSELTAETDDGRVAELATLVGTRRSAEDAIVALRALLTSLRDRRSEVKAAA